MLYRKTKSSITVSVLSLVFFVSSAQSQFVGVDYFSMNESSLPAIDYDGLWGHVIYSMETINLPADIGLYNYEVKNDEYSGICSSAGFKVGWNKYYLGFYGKSTDSYFPTDFSSGESDDSLAYSALDFFLGKENLKLRVKQNKISGTGIADGPGGVLVDHIEDENGRVLSTGEEFPLQLERTVLAIAYSGSKDNAYGEAGIGYLKENAQGLKKISPYSGSDYAVLDSNLSGSGLLGYFSYGAGLDWGEYVQPTGGINGEIGWALLFSISLGYEVGLNITPTDNMLIRTYLGGYLWHGDAVGDTYEEEVVVIKNALFATTAGIQFNVVF